MSELTSWPLRNFEDSVASAIRLYQSLSTTSGNDPKRLTTNLESAVEKLREELEKKKRRGEISESDISSALEYTNWHLSSELSKIFEGYTFFEKKGFEDPLKYLGVSPTDYIREKIKKIDRLMRKDLSPAAMGYTPTVEALLFHLDEIVAIGNRYQIDTPEVSVLISAFMEKFTERALQQIPSWGTALRDLSITTLQGVKKYGVNPTPYIERIQACEIRRR